MNEKEDTEDLDAALAELSAHRVPGGDDPDPETRALMARKDVREAIEVRRAIAEMPDPPAPSAVELAGDGPLLVQAEAVATYVAPVEVTLPAAPRMPSGPVRIKTDADPRRAKTARVVRVGEGATTTCEEDAGEEDNAGHTEPREGAAETAPRPVVPVLASRSAASVALSSRRPASRAVASREGKERRGLGLLIGGAILFVAGAVTVLAGVRGPGHDSGNATSGEAAGRPTQVSADGAGASSVHATSPGAPSGGSVAAMGTSAVTAGGGAPTATVAKSSGARSVTTATGDQDPYADASASLPSASLPSASSGAAPGRSGTTSAEPMLTSPDAAPPVATMTAASTPTGTKPSSDRWFQKE